MSTVRKSFATHVGDLGDRVVDCVISTSNPDRERDRVIVSGLQLDNFKRNPVVLWAHDYKQPPIARCTDVGVDTDGRLRAMVQFLPEGVSPTGDVVHKLIKQGAVNATSIGFNPREQTPNELGGYDFTRAELLEVSFVPVPANPEALIVARTASKALDVEQFFLSPRGGDLDVTAADVRAVAASSEVRQHIAAQVGAKLRLATTPPDADLVTLDDEAEDVLAGLTADDVRAAVADAVGPMVREAVARRVGIARGRID